MPMVHTVFNLFKSFFFLLLYFFFLLFSFFFLIFFSLSLSLSFSSVFLFAVLRFIPKKKGTKINHEKEKAKGKKKTI